MPMGSYMKREGNFGELSVEQKKNTKDSDESKKLRAHGMWPPDALPSNSKTPLFALINSAESRAVITFSKIHNRDILLFDSLTKCGYHSLLQQTNAEL